MKSYLSKLLYRQANGWSDLVIGQIPINCNLIHFAGAIRKFEMNPANLFLTTHRKKKNEDRALKEYKVVMKDLCKMHEEIRSIYSHIPVTVLHNFTLLTQCILHPASIPLLLSHVYLPLHKNHFYLNELLLIKPLHNFSNENIPDSLFS